MTSIMKACTLFTVIFAAVNCYFIGDDPLYYQDLPEVNSPPGYYETDKRAEHGCKYDGEKCYDGLYSYGCKDKDRFTGIVSIARR